MKLGEPKKELEKIENYKEVIFWSFSRKDYQKQIGGPRQQVQISVQN